MSFPKLFLIIAATMLMFGAVVSEVNRFSNGEELQAIFDVLLVIFNAVVWVWIKIYIFDD